MSDRFLVVVPVEPALGWACDDRTRALVRSHGHWTSHQWFTVPVVVDAAACTPERSAFELAAQAVRDSDAGEPLPGSTCTPVGMLGVPATALRVTA